MPGIKGKSTALPQVLEMIRRHGSATTEGVANYLEISPLAAGKRLERLRKLGRVSCDISLTNGKQYVWREIVRPDKPVRELMKEIGKRIRATRLNRAKSQKDLTNESGVSQSSYSRIENGDGDFNVVMAIRIAKSLNVSLNWILLGE